MLQLDGELMDDMVPVVAAGMGEVFEIHNTLSLTHTASRKRSAQPVDARARIQAFTAGECERGSMKGGAPTCSRKGRMCSVHSQRVSLVVGTAADRRHRRGETFFCAVLVGGEIIAVWPAMYDKAAGRTNGGSVRLAVLDCSACITTGSSNTFASVSHITLTITVISTAHSR